MKIHLKYIYVGILAILVLWSGFNIYNGYHKLNVEKAAIAKQAENMDTLVSQSIKACYKAYDDVHATQEEKDKLRNYRVFFTSRKTLLNEFNHFEGNMNIFQPAIDITETTLQKEIADIENTLMQLRMEYATIH